MNYLVTGGAGFIGNHLVLRLHEEGHSVTVVDNVNDYYDLALKEARLKRLPEAVKVLKIDITDFASFEEVFRSQEFDAICHLAAQAGVRYSLEHPETYVSSNYVGTFNVFELAKKYNVKKIIFASSSSVYGASTQIPFTEEDSVFSPVSVYASTKRACELLGSTYSHLYNMDITCLRFFTVYGPWGRPDMAPFIFTDKIYNDQQIDVFNNGEMRRDFTYIDDIVDGFTLALNKAKGFEIFNLGNGKPVQLMEFIETIETKLGKKADINFMPMQQGDVPETYADISKAKTMLGYEPKTEIEAGISEYIDWYMDFYKK
ncbi:SDR family NAD(P)-dependent oxidoreductase [Candidatus Pacebacteria bacterium]|nr:SDR family NAD(P)-dependent oxidoreductase [Candidatus Paceibacterota bacterium]